MSFGSFALGALVGGIVVHAFYNKRDNEAVSRSLYRTLPDPDTLQNTPTPLAGFGLRRGNYGTRDTQYCRW